MDLSTAEEISTAWHNDPRRSGGPSIDRLLKIEQRLARGLVHLPEPTSWTTTQALGDDGLDDAGVVHILMLTDRSLLVSSVTVTEDNVTRFALATRTLRLEAIWLAALSKWVELRHDTFREDHSVLVVKGSERVACISHSRIERQGLDRGESEADFAAALLGAVA